MSQTINANLSPNVQGQQQAILNAGGVTKPAPPMTRYPSNLCIGNVCGYFLGPARVTIFTGTNPLGYDQIVDITVLRRQFPDTTKTDSTLLRHLAIGQASSYQMPANTTDSFDMYPVYHLPVKNANGTITPGKQPEMIQMEAIRQNGMVLLIHFKPTSSSPWTIKKVVLSFSFWDVNTDWVPKWRNMRFEFLPTRPPGGGTPQFILNSANPDLRLVLSGARIPN